MCGLALPEVTTIFMKKSPLFNSGRVTVQSEDPKSPELCKVGFIVGFFNLCSISTEVIPMQYQAKTNLEKNVYRTEARHGKAFKGLLERYFGK